MFESKLSVIYKKLSSELELRSKLIDELRNKSNIIKVFGKLINRFFDEFEWIEVFKKN